MIKRFFIINSPDRAPRVCISLAFLHRIPVRNERVVHLTDSGKTPTQQVQRLTGLGISLDRLLQTVYGERVALSLLAERLNAMVHPSQLAVDVGLQLGRQLFFGQQQFVGFLGGFVFGLRLMQMSDVKADCAGEGEKIKKKILIHNDMIKKSIININCSAVYIYWLSNFVYLSRSN